MHFPRLGSGHSRVGPGPGVSLPASFFPAGPPGPVSLAAPRPTPFPAPGLPGGGSILGQDLVCRLKLDMGRLTFRVHPQS